MTAPTYQPPTGGFGTGRPLTSRRTAVWLALLVTVLWSSSWVLIRIGLDEEGLTPLTFAALRYGLAAVVLVIWVIFREARHRERYHVDRGFIARLILLGVMLYAVTQGAQFVALNEQPAATTSLILSLTPMFVAAGAAISLAEIPTRWQVGGTGLVVLGAWLYFAGDLGATAAGMVAASIGLGANVISSLLGRGINRARRLPPTVVTASSMGVGAGILVFVGIGAEGTPDISTRGWFIISWLAVVNTALAFSLWNLSLQRLTAIESAGINNTMLIQIAVLAWVFLGEAPGLVGIVGIVLVSIGVYLTQTRAAEKAAAGGDAGPGATPEGRSAQTGN